MIRNRLKEILNQKGVKQTWLAEKAGIDRSTISTVIANRKSTNLESGMRIARALDMSVEDVFEIIDD